MNTLPANISIVDDDWLVRDLLASTLRGEGFHVDTYATGEALLGALDARPCDLVLVDIGLPDTDGFALTNRLLSQYRCGIIMVTARRDMESRLMGLEQGADAYLVKPVDLRELKATVCALLRRIERERHPTLGPPTWRFEPRYWRLVGPDEVAIPLTQSECLLLDVLIRHQGGLVERDHLITAMGHSPAYFGRTRLDTMISRLRRKIQSYCPDWRPLVTERNKGYAFVTVPD